MRNCGNCAISDCSLRRLVASVNEYLPVPGNSFYRVTRINMCIATTCLLFKNRGVNRHQRTRDLLSYIRSKGKEGCSYLTKSGRSLWQNMDTGRRKLQRRGNSVKKSLKERLKNVTDYSK